jgi:transposase
MLVLQAVKSVREAELTLSLIISQMQEIASTLPEYSVVREMKGVGDILSVRLIGEIGDVRRFRNGSSLVAFAGIDAPPYESGKFVGTNRNISKRGSSTLRKIGYEIMHSLKVSKPTEDSAVYDFIIKKENEGKPKRVAKIAGLNKFLRIYYARVMALYC